jgi:type III pantothenate kinase
VNLLLDIGNTRVKWALLKRDRLCQHGAAVHAGWTLADWRRLLRSTAGLQSVFAASVAGPASVQALAAAADELGIGLRFIESQPRAAGVINAYAEPRQLGVDRWLAVIAAYHLTGQLCGVVDVGTAATVDAVRGDGRHLGGFIVPGPALMASSLMTGTSDLAERFLEDLPSGGQLLADNTRDAIERGSTLAVAALVDRVVADLENTEGNGAKLLLTGGGAEQIRPQLRTTAQVVPDLVLQGIAILSKCNENHSQ